MFQINVSFILRLPSYIDRSGPLGVSISNMLTSTFQSHDKLSNLQDVVTKPGKRNFGNRKSDQPHSHVIKGNCADI